MNDASISLYELNHLIKGILQDGLSSVFWIRAEMSDVRVNQNGHCYLEFIEKDKSGRTVIAKSRAMIWANTFHILRPYFENSTNQSFASGLKVLVQVSVEFHELYGFSLTVHDIDPSYTLGDQAMNRAAILKQLEEDGVLTLNKELDLAQPTQRIAVISSPTAAGYEDFCDQLHKNGYGFAFYLKLFPAIMQGDRSESSIIAALEKIYKYQDCFDAVVIIRGGGATSDLSCFDSYLLAASCAQFPLPIITGIGHERDETVLDIVAHTRAKTPTAVAEFLIATMYDELETLEEIHSGLAQTVNDLIQTERLRLNSYQSQTAFSLKSWSKEQDVLLTSIKIDLKRNISLLVRDNNDNLANKEDNLKRNTLQLVKENNQLLDNCSNSLKRSVAYQIKENSQLLSTNEDVLKKQSNQLLKDKRLHLDTIEKHLSLLSPETILKKGYTLTFKNNKVIKDTKTLSKGDRLETLFSEGKVISIVDKVDRKI